MNQDVTFQGVVFTGRVINQEPPKGPKVELFIAGETTPITTIELEAKWRGAVTQCVQLAFNQWVNAEMEVSPAVSADLRKRLEKLRDESAANLPFFERSFRFVGMSFRPNKPDEARFILTEDQQPAFSTRATHYSINL